ncbi:MAG: hypothetical protein LBU42_10630 [Prevotellaceae bacterium]|jgi:hypothetical protein|nr:hypothetical protein [Prevotellaceae bacterium]
MFYVSQHQGCLQTQTNLIKQPLAAIFCLLPIIAESFNNRFLQFVSLTFMALSPIPAKKLKVETGVLLIIFEVQENPAHK